MIFTSLTDLLAIIVAIKAVSMGRTTMTIMGIIAVL